MTELWTEKYRPKIFEEVIGQDEQVKLLKNSVISNNIPNLLLVGEPGTGKTTLAYVIKNELKINEENFLEINASDERGIETVRRRVKNFIMYGSGEMKLLLLDEADALTNDAQYVLRRLMEKYSSSIRFILTANYKNKIIKPLQSRCMVVGLKRLSDDDIFKLLTKILEKENFKINEYYFIHQISKECMGDARKAIILLENSTKNNIKSIFEEIGSWEKFWLFVKGKEWNSAKEEMRKLANGDEKIFLQQFFNFILEDKRSEIKGKEMDLSVLFAKYENNLTFSQYPFIQLCGFLSELMKMI